MKLQTHPPPFRSTAEAAAQQNQVIMEAIDQKELLHLRIEQANDKLLEALVAMTEGLFKVYQPEVLGEDKQKLINDYEANLKPMTVEEMEARAIASNEDIAAGRVYDLDQVAAEMGL